MASQTQAQAKEITCVAVLPPHINALVERYAAAYMEKYRRVYVQKQDGKNKMITEWTQPKEGAKKSNIIIQVMEIGLQEFANEVEAMEAEVEAAKAK